MASVGPRHGTVLSRNALAIPPNLRGYNLPVVPTALQADSFLMGKGYCAVWKITSFINRERIISPYFFILNFKFKFTWERNSYQNTGRECFELFLECERVNVRRELRQIKVTTYLSDRNDKRTSVQIVTKTDIDKTKVLYFRIWHEETSSVFSELSDLTEDGSFAEAISRIQVKTFPLIDIRDQWKTKIYDDPLTFLSTLSTDSKKLYDSGEFADVTLKCGENTIKAHKVLLSVRSKKFAELILNNEEVINIDDLDYSILSEMVRYIYSGKMPVVSREMVVDLYRAAWMYGIEGLRIACASMLMVNLEPDRLLEHLSVAEEFSDTWFKEKAHTYLQQRGHLVREVPRENL